MIGTLLGGIGLFLLGMVLMTDGLKAAAGDALRKGLERLTGGAGRAMMSGVAVTALIQSSSATVLTTIGFVSAGLLTFTQAVGVIFGANVGTTSTGWIVAVLGLKVDIAALALPLVGVGALARFLLKGRGASAGMALAGFGVIFVGIDMLQTAMSGLAEHIDPGSFPGATLLGRVGLVVVGAAMTVVLQSSSAAVATTLTALHAGTIDLGQATMLVIGQNLGTTVTAAIAAIGATVAAKRTALAHILFNVVAGIAAFALAPLFLHLVVGVELLPGIDDPAVALAAFHTAFNLLGVAILLPAADRFGAMVIRMIPDRGAELTRHLDPSVAEIPSVAIEAARRAVLSVAALEVEAARHALANGGPSLLDGVHATLTQAFRETRAFLGHVRTSPDGADTRARHLAVLHALDHLERLEETLRETRGRTIPDDPATRRLRSRIVALLEGTGLWLTEDGPSPEADVAALSRDVAEHRRARRIEILADAASGGTDPGEALPQLEGLRWMDRVVYHVWRAVHHLAAPGQETAEDHHAEVFVDPDETGASV